MAFASDRLNASRISHLFPTRANRLKRLRRRMVLENLEQRLVLDATLTIDPMNRLVFLGDSTAANDITVAFTPDANGGTYTITDPGFKIDITDNGSGTSTTGSGTPTVTVTNLSSLGSSQLAIRGNSSFGDTINIQSINDFTFVNEVGGGLATYNIGDTSHTTQGINRSLVLLAQDGKADINIDDSGYSLPTNVNLHQNGGTFASLSGLNPGAITYDQATTNSFTVKLGSGGNIFTDSANGADYPITVDTGTGSDFTSVLRNNGPLTINGQGGSDQVVLGNRGSLAGFQGPVTVTNATGKTALTVDDSADPSSTGENPILTGDPNTGLATLAGLTPSPIMYKVSDLDQLVVNSGTGDDTLAVNFNGLNPLPQNILNGLVYNGGGGSNTLRLFGGGFQNETYDTFRAGSGEINYNDGGTPGNFTDIDFNGLKPVVDNVAVVNLTANVSSDTVNVATGPIISGQNYNTVGSGDTPAQFEALMYANKANVTINTTTTFPNGVTLNVSDPIRAAGQSSLTLNGSGEGDTVNLFAIPTGLPTKLNTLAGNDLVNVALQGVFPSSPFDVDGGAGQNALVIDAKGATGPADTHIINAISAPFSDGTHTVDFNNFLSVVVNNNFSVPPVVTGEKISSVQGQALNNVEVATFTSSDPGAKAGDFVATIDWGDNTKSAGTITQDAQNPSVFHVTGSHVYTAAGTFNMTTTVRHIASTLTTTTNGKSLTINTGPSGPVTGASTTSTVTASPINVTAFSINGTEGLPIDLTQNPIIGSFTDSSGAQPASNYKVTINWGDGTTFTGTPGQLITQSGSNFSIADPGHTYAEEGHYTITLSVISIANPSAPITASAASAATIADAPLTAVPSPVINPTEGVPFFGQVASFTDANPKAPTSDFTATVDWGDGSPTTTGIITQPGGVGTPFIVSGVHTYNNALVNGSAASFIVSVQIKDVGGASVQAGTVAHVQQQPFTVTGELNPASDSGLSNTDNVTNVVQPNFVGFTQPGATVQLVGAPSNLGTPLFIGQGVADASGYWSVTSFVPLPQGSYKIIAHASNKTGFTTADATIVNPLVIDTAGPKVTAVAFDRVNGQIDLTLADNLSGLDQTTVADASNYHLTRQNSKKLFLVNNINIDPTSSRTDDVVLTFNDGRQIRGGSYTFTVFGQDAIKDIAGNKLDGVFYGFLPSGNNHPGSNFVAQLDAIHHRVLGPKTVIGHASPLSPPGTLASGESFIPTANPNGGSGRLEALRRVRG
jgi:hypothetical protein